MTYPDGIDALVNVNANDSLAAGGHAARHNSVNTALVEIKNMLGPSPAGKIMQIVRATDSTDRSTTSTSFTDVTGMSVTITPQKNDSAILIFVSARVAMQWSVNDEGRAAFQITDASNNPISGSESYIIGNTSLSGTSTRDSRPGLTLVAYATPATFNATTYKVRFRSLDSLVTTQLQNSLNTGQMYAIEVSA
jgi:hypothetical protein